jgi:branched-subunit amino acid aminotransferase/4-amino-4-deoxychorismate lyase
MTSNTYIILNGEIVEEENALVSPVNRGMMYGDGCFETMKSYSGKFLGWDMHFDRLEAGLTYLNIDLPFNSDQLKAQIQNLLTPNELSHKETMIRLQCWREGGRGYHTDSSSAGWMIQASEISIKEKVVQLTLAKTRCIPSEALERKYKLSNGLNYIQAAQEAKRKSCDDALMLTMCDKISETTSANIFWVKDGQVFTPAIDCDLLPGVTRSLTIELIQSLDIPLEEGVYNVEDIQEAEAVICTNSIKEITEVNALDGIHYKLGHPVVMKIVAGFEQYKNDELSE